MIKCAEHRPGERETDTALPGLAWNPGLGPHAPALGCPKEQGDPHDILCCCLYSTCGCVFFLNAMKLEREFRPGLDDSFN